MMMVVLGSVDCGCCDGRAGCRWGHDLHSRYQTSEVEVTAVEPVNVKKVYYSNNLYVKIHRVLGVREIQECHVLL